ncbi:restriction endonuclease subunit S [Nostoc sp. UHCC 0870]|uniref:restriction endonuclease subunit S n=1 Tax=Nostoc sp. UHCC 0870 TaxID=2914041 RepID=UPI001EE131CA|nr:restriction endonuclease subunit S [Nostoc sp. UHCC 0870]UKO98371.1 restriction endonuclease subunit S [Nostoc sp. UHCC 0870]
MKCYSNYRDSGLAFVEKIPQHWDLKRAKYFFYEIDERSEKGDEDLLSVSHITGVTPRSEKNITMFMAESYEGYKTCIPNDLVINIMWAWMGALGVSKYQGIISSAYGVYRQKNTNNFYTDYLEYLVRIPEYIAEYTRRSKGIRSSRLRMYSDDFFQIPIICPPIEEQRTIAHFLDRKLEQIDHFISNKQRLIELLKEQKSAIANRAVTKGLNPHAPMKPSSIEWLREIPEHWEAKRAKYYFYEVDERSETGTEELLSVSHITGVTPRSEKNITMFQAESYEGYKTCQVGDLVSNIMWAWMGALGVSNYSGIVSSSYGVYRQKNPDNFVSRYLDYLVRTNSYISEFICRSKGIRSSRLRMYTDDFFDIPIIKPPKEEQEKILSYIDAESAKIDLAIAKIEKEIELIQEYRTTLISNAVTGKIDVRELTYSR